ncbi:TraI domain-containing protein [Paraburkholderia sp. A2WS-5]|uniref:TraI domain-containing protein n=1 Tax=unclassified Paraburkholderia TaxID=2615204 RepID=UPI003B7A09A7
MTASALHSPIEAAALLAVHDRRVALIRQAANEATDAEYRLRWGDVLGRCAAWFSSLPWSPQLYREPGGAFRCTVETAFYAMRLAGGQKFGTNLPSEHRRRIEPQYNHAVFLAAVCSGLDEPYRHFVVLRERDRAEWNPAAHGPLGPWLGGSAYALQRRAAPLPVERMRTALFAQNLIGHDLLTGYEADVLAQLFGAINPVANPQGAESLVHKVVRQAVNVAADFDRKAQQGVYEAVQYPVPAAIHVAAAVQPVVTPAAHPVAAQPSGAGSARMPGNTAATPSAAMPAPPASAAVDAGQAASPHSVPVAPMASPQAAARAPEPSSVMEAIQDDLAQAVAGEDESLSSPAPDSMPTTASPKHDPQLGLPFQGDAAAALAARTAPTPIDPAAMRPRAPRQERAGVPGTFDQVLEGQPNMIREFFRALAEDVAAGKAKVAWTDKGLSVPKRLVGSYGVASDTLVEHLRKKGLLVANVQAEIVLAPRAGELIVERHA